MMPRGIGSFLAMFIVGRLVGRVDTRLILLAGLGLCSLALLQMSHFSLTMDSRPFVVSGIVQGLGIGLLFVPLSVTAFATLSPAMRAEGTAVYTLIRNMGSSVGISMMEALDTQQSAVSHADMAGAISPGNPAQSALVQQMGSGAGLEALNGQITAQATMVALVDVFRLMLLMTICVAPLLLIMRKPKTAPPPGEVIVE
jgi:DHA2 family multidrug resistance protein